MLAAGDEIPHAVQGFTAVFGRCNPSGCGLVLCSEGGYKRRSVGGLSAIKTIRMSSANKRMNDFPVSKTGVGLAPPQTML
jgi:hypothetical protein